MENTIQLELLALVKACQQFQNDNLPPKCHLHIDLNGPDSGTIYVHTHQDHSVGLEVKRILGVENASKTNYDPESPWHALHAKIAENINLSIMCSGLPPMCRVETYEEEIPKEQVIQTGEKTIVKRTRICCGSEAK